MHWICCQLGAREHYAIPRVLNQRNELGLLITDAWADSQLPWKLGLHSRALERFHSDLAPDFVESFDWQLLWFELLARLRLSGWERTIARNEWFQDRAIVILKRLRERNPEADYTLFSYSYAARRLFEFAKDSGWSTVLGQIDPGPFEEEIVMNLHEQAGCRISANPAPPAYWANWRSECSLADRIVVNSHWSRQGLLAEGVPVEKIQVIPLAFDPSPAATNYTRTYPTAFNSTRPLRILFLGQVNLRKGIREIFSAVSKLANRAVQFWIVGDVQFPVPPEYEQHPCIKWLGTVPRSEVAKFYRDADVFLFPTFSDGFGLTQLEAQSWNLPVIASRRCGDVVQDGLNGYLLADVSADEIAHAIENILAEPDVLRLLASRSRTREFTLDKLYSRLNRLQPCDDLCSSY